jgi:two-component system sensor histidine kinase YesM
MKAELEYTEKYLECMKFRYRDNLSYSFKIVPGMNEIHIPKLLIQPLVENAIKHGTRNEPPWCIAIEAFIDDHQWQVMVKDNGPGFTNLEIANIQQKIKEIDRSG